MAYDPVSTSVQSLPFLQAMLKAFTGPNTANFHALAQNPKASAGQGFLWIAIATAIGSLISGVLFTVFPITSNPFQPGPLMDLYYEYGGVELPESFNLAQGPVRLLIVLVCGIPLGVILAVIGTAIAAGLIHLVASLLGGQGEYGKMVYMLALIQVPIVLVTSIITPIPYLGCLGALLSLYALVLEVLAIDGVYKFGVAKAVLTLLIPVVVICLVVVCIAVGIVSFIAIAARETFQNLPQEFPMP